MKSLENMKDEELFSMTIETGNKVREAMYTGNNELYKVEGEKFKVQFQEILRREKLFQYQSAVRMADMNGLLRYTY